MDCVGDLALAGRRVRARVGRAPAEPPWHVTLVRAMLAAAAPPPPAAAPSGPAPPTSPAPREPVSAIVYGIEQIMQVLPHRYPFLLVDRILELDPLKRVVGIKNVTINEPFFQGHFPGHPVMPGVLIVEAMAQTGGVLLLGTVESAGEKVVYFMSLDNVKFRTR
jgi:UDP-3-O-[3-hydroxymyristoyl] N-acetylglucosamine deacetylase/3-hydroxyacyl-[acyl-carrier-protein] dehydratase